MNVIRISTRASKLALAQAQIVADKLKELLPGVQFTFVKVSTKGDRDRSDFLYKSESVGLFTSEVENTLLEARADLAVHSLKDLPTTSPPGLLIAAVLKREHVADALVASEPIRSISDLKAGATVGTSSLRRIAQLKNLRPDLNCVPLRGNVETRIRKVAMGQVDAVVVASAGLRRLGLADKISVLLEPEHFLIAPGQGALAVQVCSDRKDLLEIVARLDDQPTRNEIEAERAVLAAMKGGCSIPLGVYARTVGQGLLIDAMVADLDGKRVIRRSCSCRPEEGVSCAGRLAEELLEAGGREILEQVRKNLHPG